MFCNLPHVVEIVVGVGQNILPVVRFHSNKSYCRSQILGLKRFKMPCSFVLDITRCKILVSLCALEVFFILISRSFLMLFVSYVMLC